MVGGRPRCRDYKVGPTTEDGCPRCLAFGHLGIHSPSPIPSFLSQPQNRMSIRQTSPSPSKNPAPNLQSISPLRRTMESVSEIRNRPMPCQSDHEPLIRGWVPPTPPTPPLRGICGFPQKVCRSFRQTLRQAPQWPTARRYIPPPAACRPRESARETCPAC